MSDAQTGPAKDLARAVWNQACGRMLDELAVGDIFAALNSEYRRGLEEGLRKGSEIALKVFDATLGELGGKL